jgi:hypothetical protein
MIAACLFLVIPLLVIMLAANFALILIFISGLVSSFHGAPFVPVKRKSVRDLLVFGGLSSGDTFYDLGSGDGRVLISAARDFGVRKAVGCEVALWPYLESKFWVRRSGLDGRVSICRKNFFKADLADATFIYIYLFPALVNRLASKLAGETNAGAKILCPSFPIDLDRHPQFKLLKSEEIGKMTAYLYQRV